MSFSSVHSSIWRKDLPFEPVMSAVQVPESDWPVRVRAAQAPCHPKRVLFAAQVPSKTVWPVSLISSQEPSAEFGFSGDTCAVQVPAKVRFTPTVAVQLPRSSMGASWAEANTVRPNGRIKARERKTLWRAVMRASSNGTGRAPPVARHGRSNPKARVADSLSLFPASNSESGALVRFRKVGCFLLLLGLISCYLARKTRIICSTQESDILCFQVLLSFVPMILHFWGYPLFAVRQDLSVISCAGRAAATACDKTALL